MNKKELGVSSLTLSVRMYHVGDCVTENKFLSQAFVCIASIMF